MANNSTCPKCGSLDVIPNLMLQPDGHGGQVLVWKDRRHSTITARVCSKCGYTELFVTNPETLLSGQKK